jgi:hypothetical protein
MACLPVYKGKRYESLEELAKVLTQQEKTQNSTQVSVKPQSLPEIVLDLRKQSKCQ